MVSKDAQAKQDALRNKLQGLAATLTKTDRILTTNPSVVVQFEAPSINAPSATDGRTIKINPNKIEIGSASGLVNLLGLNYHEVCHILFSPRVNDATMSAIQDNGYFHAWNILEDMRIESLFAAMYGRASKFFTAPVMTYIVGNEDAWDLAHLMTYGRRFLPKAIRDEFRAQFRGTTAQRDRAERIIRAYRKIHFPQTKYGAVSVDGKILSLVEDFAKLLADLVGQGPDPLNNHPQCSQNHRNQGQMDQDAAESASQRQDDEDASQDEEENGSDDDGSDGSGDVDPEDEEGESQASGDAGDDFEDEDESDETDDGDSGRGDDGSDDDAEDESGSDAHGSADDASDSDGDAERGDGTPSGSGDGDPEDQSGGVDGAGAGRSPEEVRDDIKSAIAEALSDVMADKEVQNQINMVQAGMDDPDYVDFEGSRQEGSRIPVTPGMVSASLRVEGELRRLREQFESGWNRGTDHGVLNISRAIESDYDPDTMYDLWEPGNEEDSGLEVVILVDLSISMNSHLMDKDGNLLTPRQTRMEAANSALWILKRGFDMNDATTSVLGFGSHMLKLYGRDDKVESHQYEHYRASHGGTQIRKELKEARRILAASDKPNRLLVVITDGEIVEGLEPDTASAALNEIPATRMLVQIGDDEVSNDSFAALCDVSCNVSSTGQLVDLVRDTVTSLLLRKVRS